MNDVALNGHNHTRRAAVADGEQPVADEQPTLPAPVLSPAREALVAHLNYVAALGQDVARAEKPIGRLRAQLAEAAQHLADAEGELRSVETAHASALAKAARDGTTKPLARPPIHEKLLRVDEARRVLNAVEAAMAECQPDFQAANLALREGRAATDNMVLGVLLECEHDAVRRWRMARDLFVACEADIRGLHSVLSEHGLALEAQTKGGGMSWFRGLEAASDLWAKQTPPSVDHRVAQQRWSSLLLRLMSDANAT